MLSWQVRRIILEGIMDFFTGLNKSQFVCFLFFVGFSTLMLERFS